MYFAYGEKEISYLKAKDKRLGDAIDRIGHIHRAVDSDLFSSVVHHIIVKEREIMEHLYPQSLRHRFFRLKTVGSGRRQQQYRPQTLAPPFKGVADRFVQAARLGGIINA